MIMSPSSLEGISDACVDRWLALIHELTGITIKPERRAMLTGRLRGRMRALDVSSYEAYLELVNSNTGEREAFVDKITTNETYFYRTPRVWEYITQTLLPDWFRIHAGKTFSVWSAASSTGEEAHTLGVVMQDFKDSHPGFEYRILGTDISSRERWVSMEHIDVHISQLKIGSGQCELHTIPGYCVGIGLLWQARQIYGLAHCLLPLSPGEDSVMGGWCLDQVIRALMQLMQTTSCHGMQEAQRRESCRSSVTMATLT